MALGSVVAHETARIPQRGGVAEQTGTLHQLPSRGQSTAQLEGDHAAEGCHLAAGQIVLWVTLQSGIDDAGHGWVALQEAGHGEGALAVACHAQREGGDAPRDEPRVEGARCPAQVYERFLADAVDSLRGSNDEAAQGVSVPVQVLGRAVQDEVGSQLQRSLQAGAGPGRVHHQKCACLVGDLGERLQVGQDEDRVGGRLHVHQLGIRLQRCTDLRQVAGIRQGDLDSLAGQVVGEQRRRAGVADHTGDQVVALAEEGERDGRHRGHPGRQCQRCLPALHCRDLVLQSPRRRVVPADVHVRAARRLHRQGVVQRRAELRQTEGRRHVDRRGQGPCLLIRALARVDCQRVERVVGHDVLSIGVLFGLRCVFGQMRRR